jgi:hypothetical protein
MPRTNVKTVTDDGTTMMTVSPELAAAIRAVDERLKAEFDWDRCYEYRGRGHLIANHVPFAARHEPAVGGPRTRPAALRGVGVTTGDETPTRAPADLNVSPELAAAVLRADAEMIAEFGGNMSWLVMAMDKTVGASNKRDGFVRPRVKAA